MTAADPAHTSRMDLTYDPATGSPVDLVDASGLVWVWCRDDRYGQVGYRALDDAGEPYTCAYPPSWVKHMSAHPLTPRWAQP